MTRAISHDAVALKFAAFHIHEEMIEFDAGQLLFS